MKGFLRPDFVVLPENSFVPEKEMKKPRSKKSGAKEAGRERNSAKKAAAKKPKKGSKQR